MNILFDAFKFHSELGLPLEVQVDAARSTGAEVNMAAFACDALGEGWKEEKVKNVIQLARPDIDWKEFRFRLMALWLATGKLPDPECWSVMKARIILPYVN